MADERRGLAFGVGAYAMWGAFPLYWPVLEPAGAIEILAHRVAWSLLTMGVLVVAMRRTPQLRRIFAVRRTRRLLSVAAVVIGLNWGVFIWGVNNGHVVETSLGYFINPLVTVVMGVVLLHETMRPLQWVAVGVAVVAVLVLTLDLGRPPWISLVLACSFGTYGLAKKKADAGAVESLTFETILLAPLAIGYLVCLAALGQGHFGMEGTTHALLLTTTGLVTAAPLLCFGAAAIRLPMVTLGLLQYLTPTLQFLTGVLLLGEDMPPGRWIGFALVWAALALFTFEMVAHRRRQLRLAAESSAM